MKFSQIERGINNFFAVSRGDQKFNRVFHPVSTAPPRELKNDNSLILPWVSCNLHRRSYRILTKSCL